MLYHGRFISVWLPHLFLGIFLAGVFDLAKILLLCLGVVCAAQFQHNLHVFTQTSSTYRVHNPLIPKIGAAIFGGGGAAITLIIALERWLFPIFVIAGFAATVLYTMTEQELLWSFGHFVMGLGGYYALTGTVGLSVALLILGICLLCYPAILCYRFITGDYDIPVEDRKKILLPKVVIVYIIGLLLAGVGAWLS